MQAERSTAPAAPAASQGAHATRKTNTQSTDAQANSPGPQDVFASLLAALGDAGTPAPLQADAPALLSDGSAGAQTLLPDSSLGASALPFGSGASATPSTSPWAQAAEPSSTAALAAAALPWAGLGSLTAGLAGGLVAQTAQMDRAADVVEGDEKNALSLLGGKAKGPQARWAGASAGLQAEAPGRIGGAIAAASAAATPASAQGNSQAQMDAASSPSPAQPAVQAPAAAERALPQAAEASAPLLQALHSALQEQRQALAPNPTDEPRPPAAPEGGQGGVAPTADGALVAPDAPAQAPDASALAGEDAMAEQVAFWVNQNSQSAEMTLDRDGQPVQVRVALQGNEAHVAFRSDQVQTREALDASTAQLRELLQAQGLVLAGVTVGDGAGAGAGGQSGPSGQPGAQGQGDGRSGARSGRAQVVAAQPVAAGRPPAAGAGPRGLDVFV